MNAGDSLLICTDGVRDTLPPEQLQFLFNPVLSPQAQTQVLRDAVLKAGAPDNLSLVVVRYGVVT